MLRRVMVGAVAAAVLLVTPGLVGVAAADGGSGNGGTGCHDGGTPHVVHIDSCPSETHTH